MTGGTLPAMTWHNIMTYAHQGVELRSLPGLPVPQHALIMADASFKEEPHPVLLTRKATDALVHLERLLDETSHALTIQDHSPGSLSALGGGKNSASPLTAAKDPQPPMGSLGN